MTAKPHRRPIAGVCRAIALCAACTGALATLSGPAAAAPGVSVKPRESWTGRIALGVQPPLQSSIGTREDLVRIWTQCQVKGTPPAIDFEQRLVLVAVRRGSTVQFAPGTLVAGNLATNVVVTPDMPAFMTCALAVVDRKGIAKVNGAPIGQ